MEMIPGGGISARNGVHPGPVRRLSIPEALRRRPLLTFGTPVLVVALTTLFLLWVSPLFQTSASIRIDDEESAGIAMMQALQVLSAQGSQIQTEIAILQS